MVKAINKSFRRLFRQINITAHIWIDETELTGFSFSNLSAILAEELDFCFHLRLSDRAGLIRFIDLEKTHRKAALTAGVDIDKIKILIIKIICRFTADKQHSQEGPCVVPQLSHIRRCQESDGNPFCQEKTSQSRRIFYSGVGNDVIFSTVDV